MRKLTVCLIVLCFCLSTSILAENSISKATKKPKFFSEETTAKASVKLSEEKLSALVNKVIDISLADYEKKFGDTPDYTPVTKEERGMGKQQVVELLEASPNLIEQARDESGEICPIKLVEVLNSQGEEESKIIIAKGNLLAVETCLMLYELDNGFYPTTSQGLDALINKPSSSPQPTIWNGPYLHKPAIDPWENPYHYIYPGIHNTNKYDLSSYGSDEIENDNDITNWN